MATCKDCLHHNVCVIVEHSTSDDEDYYTEFGCDDFKDKSQYAEVKHGEWIAHGYKWRCSCCSMRINIDGTPIDNGLYYCPNCGAKMGEKRKD